VDRWRPPQLWLFGSVAAIYALQTAQFSPLLTGAALLPGLGVLLFCKPTIGLALFIAQPSRAAVVGALIAAVVGLALFPGWPREWLVAARGGPQIVPLVTRAGGVFILLALLRWRRADARLLAAMAVIPHTPIPYEAIPLFLIPRTVGEGALLAGLTVAVKAGVAMGAPYATWNAAFDRSGQLMIVLLYLPCVFMVLRRPNAWTRLLDAPTLVGGNLKARSALTFTRDRIEARS
jgi:hypothetical protein